MLCQQSALAVLGSRAFGRMARADAESHVKAVMTASVAKIREQLKLGRPVGVSNQGMQQAADDAVLRQPR